MANYRIDFTDQAIGHMANLTARQRSIVLDGVQRHLYVSPNTSTRNRKARRAESSAAWELRLRELRVYYDVVDVPVRIVSILAVGVKERSIVRAGGKRWEP